MDSTIALALTKVYLDQIKEYDKALETLEKSPKVKENTDDKNSKGNNKKRKVVRKSTKQ